MNEEKSTCASSTSTSPSSWNSIDWKKCECRVRKLQVRIAKACNEGRYNKVKSLQRLLVTSLPSRRIYYPPSPEYTDFQSAFSSLIIRYQRITNPYTLEMEKIGKQATGWKQFPREILLCFIIGNGGLYHKNERKNKIG